jgi:hypothetical protein
VETAEKLPVGRHVLATVDPSGHADPIFGRPGLGRRIWALPVLELIVLGGVPDPPAGPEDQDRPATSRPRPAPGPGPRRPRALVPRPLRRLTAVPRGSATAERALFPTLDCVTLPTPAEKRTGRIPPARRSGAVGSSRARTMGRMSRLAVILCAAVVAVTAFAGVSRPARADSSLGGPISRSEILDRAQDWYNHPQRSMDSGCRHPLMAARPGPTSATGARHRPRCWSTRSIRERSRSASRAWPATSLRHPGTAA